MTDFVTQARKVEKWDDAGISFMQNHWDAMVDVVETAKKVVDAKWDGAAVAYACEELEPKVARLEAITKETP